MLRCGRFRRSRGKCRLISKMRHLRGLRLARDSPRGSISSSSANTQFKSELSQTTAIQPPEPATPPQDPHAQDRAMPRNLTNFRDPQYGIRRSLRSFGLRLGKVGRGAFEQAVRRAAGDDPLPVELIHAMQSARSSRARLEDRWARCLMRNGIGGQEYNSRRPRRFRLRFGFFPSDAGNRKPSFNTSSTLVSLGAGASGPKPLSEFERTVDPPR